MNNMSTVALLRSKGLTDRDIQDIIDLRQAKQLQDTYTKGFKDGVRSTIGVFAEVAKYQQTDEELAS